MAEVLIIGDSRTTEQWSVLLVRAGHTVETVYNAMDMQERFAGAGMDIVIIDISNADWGEAMLIPQARATWPGCRIIAVASSYAFRSSAVYQMGLWTPDQLLIKPVLSRILKATVAFLWAQIRSERLRASVAALPAKPENGQMQPDGPRILSQPAGPGLPN